MFSKLLKLAKGSKYKDAWMPIVKIERFKGNDGNRAYRRANKDKK